MSVSARTQAPVCLTRGVPAEQFAMESSLLEPHGYRTESS